MTEDQKKQYEVCKVRGHTPSNIVLTSKPPWNVCKHCGIHYRFEQKLVEGTPWLTASKEGTDEVFALMVDVELDGEK